MQNGNDQKRTPLQHRNCYTWAIVNISRSCIIVGQRWKEPTGYKYRHHNNKTYFINEGLCQLFMSHLRKKITKNVYEISLKKVYQVLEQSDFFVSPMDTTLIPAWIYYSVKFSPYRTRRLSSTSNRIYSSWVSHLAALLSDYVDVHIISSPLIHNKGPLAVPPFLLHLSRSCGVWCPNVLIIIFRRRRV